MELNIFPSDETPTPTNLINNSDIERYFQNINPFDETFRNATVPSANDLSSRFTEPLERYIQGDLNTPFLLQNEEENANSIFVTPENGKTGIKNINNQIFNYYEHDTTKNVFTHMCVCEDSEHDGKCVSSSQGSSQNVTISGPISTLSSCNEYLHSTAVGSSIPVFNISLDSCQPSLKSMSNLRNRRILAKPSLDEKDESSKLKEKLRINIESRRTNLTPNENKTIPASSTQSSRGSKSTSSDENDTRREMYRQRNRAAQRRCRLKQKEAMKKMKEKLAILLAKDKMTRAKNHKLVNTLLGYRAIIRAMNKDDLLTFLNENVTSPEILRDVTNNIFNYTSTPADNNNPINNNLTVNNYATNKTTNSINNPIIIYVPSTSTSNSSCQRNSTQFVSKERTTLSNSSEGSFSPTVIKFVPSDPCSLLSNVNTASPDVVTNSPTNNANIISTSTSNNSCQRNSTQFVSKEGTTLSNNGKGLFSPNVIKFVPSDPCSLLSNVNTASPDVVTNSPTNNANIISTSTSNNSCQRNSTHFVSKEGTTLSNNGKGLFSPNVIKFLPSDSYSLFSNINTASPDVVTKSSTNSINNPIIIYVPSISTSNTSYQQSPTHFVSKEGTTVSNNSEGSFSLNVIKMLPSDSCSLLSNVNTAFPEVVTNSSTNNSNITSTSTSNNICQRNSAHFVSKEGTTLSNNSKGLFSTNVIKCFPSDLCSLLSNINTASPDVVTKSSSNSTNNPIIIHVPSTSMSNSSYQRSPTHFVSKEGTTLSNNSEGSFSLNVIKMLPSDACSLLSNVNTASPKVVTNSTTNNSNIISTSTSNNSCQRNSTHFVSKEGTSLSKSSEGLFSPNVIKFLPSDPCSLSNINTASPDVVTKSSTNSTNNPIIIYIPSTSTSNSSYQQSPTHFASKEGTTLSNNGEGSFPLNLIKMVPSDVCSSLFNVSTPSPDVITNSSSSLKYPMYLKSAPHIGGKIVNRSGTIVIPSRIKTTVITNSNDNIFTHVISESGHLVHKSMLNMAATNPANERKIIIPNGVKRPASTAIENLRYNERSVGGLTSNDGNRIWQEMTNGNKRLAIATNVIKINPAIPKIRLQ